MARTRAIRFDVRFTDEQAVNAYAEHGTYSGAALALGVGMNTVRCRLRLLDVPKLPPKPRRFDVERTKRAKHQHKVRDANRAVGQCLNSTKHKQHATPSINPKTGLAYSKCDACREIHRKGTK